jgi:16S rRNA processing protein RimM
VSAPPQDRRICVAQIGAPHGVRGEVRLHAFTTDPLAVARYGPLEAEDGARSFAISGLRPAKGFLVARLAGVQDRGAAAQLTHCRLFVRRDRLPALEEPDDFYHADLIGLVTCDLSGRELGVVTAVHNFGAGDLLEVKPVAGPTLMFPFTKAGVPVVDLAAGKLLVDPPEGSIPVPQGGRGEPGGADHPLPTGAKREKRGRARGRIERQPADG